MLNPRSNNDFPMFLLLLYSTLIFLFPLSLTAATSRFLSEWTSETEKRTSSFQNPSNEFRNSVDTIFVSKQNDNLDSLLSPDNNSEGNPLLERRFPEAIIIGVKKGGTRALLEYLRLNPLVKAPGPEVHFFDRHYHRGIEWYRRQMPLTTSVELTLEKTPSYFITKSAPERIHALNPAMKLLVVVRDPVTRAISDYTQTASKRAGMPSFEDMAFNKTTGSVNTSWGAVKIGIYHRHVKRWLKFFPLKQIHFVNGEKLISHPAEETRAVEEFLELPPSITRDNFKFNETKGFPCLVKKKIEIEKGKLHCLGKTKGRTHPTIHPMVTDTLRAFYLTQNDKFYRMVHRNFGW